MSKKPVPAEPLDVEDAADVDHVAGSGGQLQLLRQQFHANQQGEFPFAIVEGRTVTTLPLDLHIPPDALEVFLEAFEGPLDLLLYLIRRQNLDILDIRVAEITEQYMRYVDVMKALQLELAAEYLVMAAMLAEIKSRMLLPRPSMSNDSEADDPRAELIRRLMEYERFKQAAEQIDALPRMDRDTFAVAAQAPEIENSRPLPDVNLKEMLLALSEVMRRAELFTRHAVVLEPLSVRERMTRVLAILSDAGNDYVPFVDLFDIGDGRRGVIVTFLAIMELAREALIEVFQNELFSPIHVRIGGGSDGVIDDTTRTGGSDV